MVPLPSKIGLISDTHGLLRVEALRALAGSELIVHAGDVGAPKILDELERIAPVIAVRGNTDTQDWCRSLPVTQAVQVLGTTLYVLHNLLELDLDPAAAGFGVIVSGHTHKPAKFEKDGVLYINPGSAGPRRFSLPIKVACLRVGNPSWEVEFVSCEGAPES